MLSSTFVQTDETLSITLDAVCASVLFIYLCLASRWPIYGSKLLLPVLNCMFSCFAMIYWIFKLTWTDHSTTRINLCAFRFATNTLYLVTAGDTFIHRMDSFHNGQHSRSSKRAQLYNRICFIVLTSCAFVWCVERVILRITAIMWLDSLHCDSQLYKNCDI